MPDYLNDGDYAENGPQVEAGDVPESVSHK